MVKKLLKLGAVLAAVVGGVLVWRKVEADRLENDLWAQAEALSDDV
jgi:hypothetical protein